MQPIRSYVRQCNPERLRTEMGPGAADIAGIVSEIREQLPGLAPPPNLEPEQARFRLFDSKVREDSRSNNRTGGRQKWLIQIDLLPTMSH